MTAYGDDLINMIDQRIGLATKRDKATGTVISRDATGPGAQVLFDGATTSMPVKCPGSVFVREGTRVLLDKYGSDWVISNAWIGPGFGEASRRFNIPSTTAGVNTTSFTDFTEFGTVGFTKFFDATYIRVGIHWSGYSNAATTGVEYGLRLTPTEGAEAYVPTDWSVGRCFMNALGDHQTDYSVTRMTGIPAGTFTATFRIRRFTGTGTIISDVNDQCLLELDEGIRSGVPYF